MRLTNIGQRRALTISLLLALGGCLVPADGVNEQATANIDITQDLYDDMKRIDLGDLFWGTGRLASDELNAWLARTPYSDIRLSETEIYGVGPSVADDLTVRDLSEIATGLAQRFGERTLPAEVNAIRRAEIQSGALGHYAETSFRLGMSFDAEQRRDVLGLGPDINTRVNIGFTGDGGIEARTVVGFPEGEGGELAATIMNPILATLEMRDFVFPRSIGDVRDHMFPGESVTLSADGRVGANYGFGVPLLLSNPVADFTYNVRLGAGIKAVLKGQLDVQLVRMNGDEAIVDVGLTGAEVESAYIALEDGFGLKGLGRDTKIVFPGLEQVEMPVGSLAEKALARELNRRISIISGRAERSQSEVRESVARFRVDLSSQDPRVAQAMQQALSGDIRAAQMMAHQGVPGITSELDLRRAARSNYGHLGVGILGMKFYRETERTEGTATVQTPDGYLSVAYDSLRRQRGSFFSEHGYGRTVLTGYEHDTDARGAEAGKTNLAFHWMEGDDHMERDKLADQLDGLLAAILGNDRYDPLHSILGVIGRGVQTLCGEDRWRERSCTRNALSNAQIVEYTAVAQRDAAAAILATDGMVEQGTRAVELNDAGRQVSDLYNFNLASHRAFEVPAWLSGPPVSMEFGTYLSDDAVRSLASRRGTDVAQVVAELVAYMRADRQHTEGLVDAQNDTFVQVRAFDALANSFDRYRNRYNLIDRIREDKAILVDFPVDADNRPVLEAMVTGNVAHRRLEATRVLIDDLMSKISAFDNLDGGAERVLGSALVALTPPALREVRVDVDMDLDSNWAESFPQYKEAFRDFPNDDEVYHLRSWTRGAGVRRLGDSIGWDIDRLTAVDGQ